MTSKKLPSTRLNETGLQIAKATKTSERLRLLADQAEYQEQYEEKNKKIMQDNLLTTSEVKDEVNKGIGELNLCCPKFTPPAMNQWFIDYGLQTRESYARGAYAYPLTDLAIELQLGKNNRKSGDAVTASWDPSVIQYVLEVLIKEANG